MATFISVILSVMVIGLPLGGAFAGTPPRFEDYSVREIFHGKNAPIRLNSPETDENGSFYYRLRHDQRYDWLTALVSEVQ